MKPERDTTQKASMIVIKKYLDIGTNREKAVIKNFN